MQNEYYKLLRTFKFWSNKLIPSIKFDIQRHDRDVKMITRNRENLYQHKINTNNALFDINISISKRREFKPTSDFQILFHVIFTLMKREATSF